MYNVIYLQLLYCGLNLIRAHQISRVPMLRSAPRRPKSFYIDIYTFCFCSFFVSLKQSYIKRQLLEIIRYASQYTYKVISESLFDHTLTDVRKQSCLSFLWFFCLALFLLSSPLFVPLPSAPEERNAG